MVGVINPVSLLSQLFLPSSLLTVLYQNSKQTLAGQLAAVRKVKVQLSPGDPIPKEGTEEGTTSSHALSGGAIAGIVVGAVAFIAIIGTLLYLFVRNRSLASVLRYSRPPQGRTAPIPHAGEPSSPYSPPPAPYPQTFQQGTKFPPMASPNQINGHESWLSGVAAAPTTVGSTSPMMSEDSYGHNGHMWPNSFVPAFNPHHSYAPVGSPPPGSPPLNYKPQPSPGETPWSPGGFAFTPQYNQAGQPHEMGRGGMGEVAAGGHAGAGANNGYVAVRAQELP